MTSARSDRTREGRLRIWTHGDANRVVFRKCADVMTQEFGADGGDRFDGGDQLFWDYAVAGLPVTLHLDRAQGIAVVAGNSSAECESIVKTIANALARLG